jgi:multidrug efflux pump subunit AcrA (membrane-fusion protein)
MNSYPGENGMKKYSKIFILLIGVLTLLTACSPKAAQPAAEAAPAQPEVLIAEGRLLPLNALDASFSIPGQVAEVLVKDGDTVKVGQVLARLNNSPEAQAALARARQEALAARQAVDSLKASADLNLTQASLAVITAKKQLDAAQTRYDADKSDENQAQLDVAAAKLKLAANDRQKLASGGGVDPDLLALAEARLGSAVAAVGSAQAAFDNLELKANLDGALVDSTLQVGQRVTAGQPVLTIADFSNWVVKTDNLTELAVGKLKVGQKVQVALDGLPGLTLTGEVTHINARFEEKRGDITYTVTIVLSQADPQMRWGMTAAVKFVP